jgi:hypothetical protein
VRPDERPMSPCGTRAAQMPITPAGAIHLGDRAVIGTT